MFVRGIVATQSTRAVSDTLTADAVGHDCASGFESVDHLATLQVQDQFLWIVKVAVEGGFSYILRDPNADEQVHLRSSWGQW